MSAMARYARHVVLPQIGVDGQQRLADASVLVLGVGGLGCAASAYLAAAGIGRLTVVDRDRVELGNLQRQILYREQDLGRRKAEAAAERLRALNSSAEIVARGGGLDPRTLDQLVGEADLVLDCSDNFRTRTDLNAACLRARRPLVSGAAVRMGGQVLAVDPAAPGCPCYVCWFGDAPQPEDRCEDAGVLGPLVGVIGAMQALFAVRMLAEGADLAGVLHAFDAGRMVWEHHRGVRDPGCPACDAVGRTMDAVSGGAWT